jgi:predicted metal-dependent peptidase
MNPNTPDQSIRLRKARIALILDHPFFGALVMNLGVAADTSIPTMCTDGVRLRYSPNFVASLNDRQVVTVLAHEVMHCALGHIFRMEHRDRKRWNMAADYAINNYFQQEIVATPAGKAAPWEWPTATPPLLDPQYEGMSAEEIYNLLPEEMGGDGDGQGDDGDGDGQPGDGDPSPGDAGFGDIEPAPGDKAQQDELETGWRLSVENAVAAAKGAGKLPAGLARSVNEVLHPKIRWTTVLRDLLTSIARDDYSWRRPNPRYLRSGFILPSLRNESMGKLIVAIDTSGSVGEAELSEFMAELNGIANECRPAGVMVIQADAAICATDEFERGEQISIQLCGGGGTDFRPVFAKVDEMTEQPAAVIYLTDGQGTFPDRAPACPVIWCVKGTTEIPFGAVVRIN